MVEFRNGDLADYKADAMAIASAFQAASDDDTRTIMNVMSERTPSSVESLKFYIVPAEWFLKAWPLLKARVPDGIDEGWREKIGRIQNETLTMNSADNREISRDEDETTMSPAAVQKKRFESLHRKMAQKQESAASLRPGLVHEKDYFFLGPSAWMLVKEKFGFDGYELERSCVLRSINTMAIEMPAEESSKNGDNHPTQIEIPPSGRFPYERVIDSKKSAVVPEEDGSNEMMAEGSENPQGPQEASASASASEHSPVLLLPPSTTATQQNNSLYPSADDMDVDSSKGSTTPSQASRKRMAVGLGNLGNTCFMNSTLQCLAHTESLRKYFLSGEYESDLNRDNPLGTGGELATQFASLLGDMWGVVIGKRRNVMGRSDSNYANSSSSAVYPRSFKYCVGKHAEQFMGYDQHDSQEFATYLLDALHEDTNRITKKPYIEKPEQGEDEPDDVAADKAWKLHLQREDSRVLENFMGQVKSRLECNEEGCNRVSTTFDPFMYLSVPIPGASERNLKVTFVPLDPDQKLRNLTLTLNKSATINAMLTKMNEELVKLCVIEEPIPIHDLCPVDVWSHEVFSWYQNDSEIDRIRDSDNTYIYQLRRLEEVKEASKQDEVDPSIDKIFAESRTKHKFKVDLGTMTRLNKDDAWQTELQNYVRQQTLLYSIFNPSRGTIDERMQFHQKLENFIDICHKEIAEAQEPSGLKRMREESDSEEKSNAADSQAEDESIQGLIDRSDTSKTFKDVKSRFDVGILEFCANKLRQFILKMVKDKRCQYQDGIKIQVIMRRPQGGVNVSNYTTFTTPLVLRIPSTMTVYGLREEVAKRISRSLPTGKSTSGSGQSSAEASEARMDMQTFGSPELLIMRQVPLTFDKKSAYSNKSISSNKKLGVLERVGDDFEESGKAPVMAKASDEEEQAIISDVVGPNGIVNFDWPMELGEDKFDINEFEATEDVHAEDPSALSEKKVTTVLSCIENYCQKEQLEETEMWYCNKCKKHVCAWKQFHIYRAPPILIVHLKRFHYSASTHRRDKITSYVDFPLEGLDLTGLVSYYTEEEKPVYDCYAVSNHYGNLGGGHYTAYILSDDGTWNYYDDSRVTNNVSTNEVKSEAAYVLYYRRRDVVVGQDAVEDTMPSQMFCETAEAPRESSEISSNNSAQAGDDSNDDMAVDGGSASSRTCSSPMGSIDGENDANRPGEFVQFVADPASNDDNFPLQ